MAILLTIWISSPCSEQKTIAQRQHRRAALIKRAAAVCMAARQQKTLEGSEAFKRFLAVPACAGIS